MDSATKHRLTRCRSCSDAIGTRCTADAGNGLCLVLAARKGGRRCPRGLHRTVAVVITSHNYGRFLRAAIDSVTGQSIRPDEIVVIDDSSDDETALIAARAGVRCVRGEWHDVRQARAAGFAATTAEVLMFLDADDCLPAHYIDAGLRAMNDDLRNAIAWSPVETFGDRSGRRHDHSCDLDRTNYMHCASLVTREAIQTADVFGGTHREPSQSAVPSEDWDMWRRIVRHGFRAVKSEAYLLYRQHGGNHSPLHQVLRRRSWAKSIYHDTPIDLMIALSGREHSRAALFEWLDMQEWPRERIRLTLYDTSHDGAFSSWVRRWLTTCQYGNVRYVADRVAPAGLADADRAANKSAVELAVARIYSRLAGLTPADSSIVWIVEDDVVPPVNAAELLLDQLLPHVGSVNGPIPSRYHGAWLACAMDGRRVEGPGVSPPVERVKGNSFGCTMLRASLFRGRSFHHGDDRGPTMDQFFYNVDFPHQQMQAVVVWECVCQHIDMEAAK